MRVGFVFIVMLVFVLSGVLTWQKFDMAHQSHFEIDVCGESNSYSLIGNGFIILYPDEITYATWLICRSGSFAKFIAGEGDLNVNLFGYVVGGLYYLFDYSWQYLFIVGVVGFLFLVFSFRKLLICLGFDSQIVLIGVAVLCLSPTVINLTSGFLRDLYVISFLNLSIIALLERKYYYFVLLTLIVAVLRTYMPVVLLPLYSYVYFDTPRKLNRHLAVFSSFALSLIFLALALLRQGSYYDTSISEIFFRFVSGFFGLNIVVMNIQEYFDQPGAAMVEKLSNLYQFVVMCILYLLVVRTHYRLHSFFVTFLYVTISLSILYGIYLGYFVARTKLVLLWLAVIYICAHLEKMKQCTFFPKKEI